MTLFKSLTQGGLGKAFERIKGKIREVGAALVDGALSRLQKAKEKLVERKDAALERGKMQAGSGALFGATIGAIGGPLGSLVGAGIGAVVGGVGGLIRGAMTGKQKGGFAGGPTLVGEAGPELLSLPRGSYVTNNEMLRAGINPPAAAGVQAGAAAGGMGGGQRGVIHLYMDSKRFASAVIDNINEQNTISVV